MDARGRAHPRRCSPRSRSSSSRASRTPLDRRRTRSRSPRESTTRRSTRRSRRTASALKIRVNGQQYLWRYDYQGQEEQLFSFHTLYVPGEHDRDARGLLVRRRALLVGAQAGRQGRRRAGPRERDLVPRRRGGRLRRASAPSSAGRATPTCARESSCCPVDDYEAWAEQQTADIKEAQTGCPNSARSARPRAPRRRAASDGSRHRPPPTPRGRHARLPRGPERLARLALDDRPQADRDHVHRGRARLLHRRRRRGAPHAPPARAGGQHADRRPDLQRARDDARDDDGLPVRHPDPRGVRELHGPADDRRARHGVPAAQRPVVLAVRHGRDRLLRVALLRAAHRGLDDVRAAVGQRLPPRRRRRRVDPPDPPDRRQHGSRRDQLNRDDPQHAHARHGLGPDAAVRLDRCWSSAT